MKYTGNMSFEDIEKAIPMLAKRGAGFRKDIQSLMLSIARQWKASGNVAHAAKLMTRIVNEVEGYYGQAIVDYGQGLYGFKWEKKAFSYTVTTLDDAMVKKIAAVPFWTFSPPREPKGFDFMAEFQKLLDKNQKKLADPSKLTDKDHVLPLDKVRAIREVLARTE